MIGLGVASPKKADGFDGYPKSKPHYKLGQVCKSLAGHVSMDLQNDNPLGPAGKDSFLGVRPTVLFKLTTMPIFLVAPQSLSFPIYLKY